MPVVKISIKVKNELDHQKHPGQTYSGFIEYLCKLDRELSRFIREGKIIKDF